MQKEKYHLARDGAGGGGGRSPQEAAAASGSKQSTNQVPEQHTLEGPTAGRTGHAHVHAATAHAQPEAGLGGEFLDSETKVLDLKMRPNTPTHQPLVN